MRPCARWCGDHLMRGGYEARSASATSGSRFAGRSRESTTRRCPVAHTPRRPGTSQFGRRLPHASFGVDAGALLDLTKQTRSLPSRGRRRETGHRSTLFLVLVIASLSRVACGHDDPHCSSDSPVQRSDTIHRALADLWRDAVWEPEVSELVAASACTKRISRAVLSDAATPGKSSSSRASEACRGMPIAR
jgi:hypothetical protein